MYFDKTTAAERSVISAVLYSAVNELRDASAILAEAIYDDLDGDTPRVEWALPRLRLAHSALETSLMDLPLPSEIPPTWARNTAMHG